MKFCVSLLALLLVNANAFAPVGISPASRQSTARAFSPIDPSNLHEIPHHIQSLQDVMSTFSIADLDVDAAPQIAGEVAKTDNGWFGFLTGPTKGFLQLIHSGLVSVGLDSNSWGISIILLTVTVKLLTYPLTKTQLESTQKMQVRCSIPVLSCPVFSILFTMS
jgi:YidC/Oxa1 family membrane protein insertase